MNRNPSHWRRFVALPLLALIVGCTPDTEPLSPHSNPTSLSSYQPHVWAYRREALVQQSIKQIAAPSLNSNAVLIHAMKRTLVHTGKTIYRLTIFNPKTNETSKIDVDEGGLPLSFDAERAKNLAARHQIYGSHTEELAQQIAKISGPATKIPVQIWYPAPPPPSRPDPNSTTIHVDHELRKIALAADLLAARTKLLAYVQPLGAQIVAQPEYAPFVEALVSKDVLVNHLKFSGKVTRIAPSLRYKESQPLSMSSSADMELFWYHPQYLGSSVRAGVIESCRECGIWLGNQVFTFNTITKKPYLACTTDADCAILTGEPQAWPRRCVANKCYGCHPTWVTGMLGMYVPGSWPLPNVGARLATIVHANDKDATHGELLNWLVSQSATIVNESWEGQSTDWHAHDYFVRNHFLTILRSAGNTLNAEVNCRSFNILCVAAYDTNGTAGYWDDDVFYPETSTVNLANCDGTSPGTGCDREQPDITGRGMNVTTATNDPSDADGLITQKPTGGTISGTSLSSPAIGSLVALMQDQNSTFKFWPELVRAVLMVSARHDIDAPVWWKTFSDYQSPDEKDGAGVPDAEHVLQVMGNGTWNTLTLRPTDFDQSGRKVIRTFFLPERNTIRFAMAWSTCPESYGYSWPWSLTVPGVAVDFDLELVDPAGNVRFSAASYDGSQEVGELEFAEPPGQWSFRIRRYNWNPCYGSQLEYVGFAYHVGS